MGKITLLFVSLLVSGVLSAAEPVVGIRLVAGVGAAAPGAPVTLGLTLRLPAGWHTYWKNPGDSGLAPRVTWALPSGSSITDPRWPTPRVFVASGEVTYGYSGEVTLLFTRHATIQGLPWTYRDYLRDPAAAFLLSLRDRYKRKLARDGETA